MISETLLFIVVIIVAVWNLFITAYLVAMSKDVRDIPQEIRNKIFSHEQWIHDLTLDNSLTALSKRLDVLERPIKHKIIDGLTHYLKNLRR